MSADRLTKEDEIDLLELLKTFWDGKWLISAFVFFSVLICVGFYMTKDPLYKSSLIYKMNNLPPFYNEDRASSDFEKMFHSQNIFKDWKGNDKNISISFEDLASTKIINGYTISKDKDERVATLVIQKDSSSRKSTYYLLVKTNKLMILDDFFNYASHINDLLVNEYILRAKKEINIIETRFKNFHDAKDSIILQLLSIDRYIVAAEKGEKVLVIQRPTKPKKVSSGLSIILPMSLVLGLIAGMFFILVLNFISRRKEQWVKSK